MINQNNKKISKKLLSFSSLVMVIALLGLMLVGCGNNKAKEEPAENKDASSSETRTIKDMAGRTVEIPAKVEKIVPLANTPRMITYLGLTDKVVGIGGMPMDKIDPVIAYAYVNKEVWRDVPIVGTDAAGATDYYPEQIIAANPDVILCSYDKELADEIQSKTGIPVVAVAMGTIFGEDYNEALTILGDVCNVPEKAAEVIKYVKDSLKDLNDRTANIPDDQKPTTLGAAATFKGAHGIEGVYSKYSVFQALNANDVAKNLGSEEHALIVDKEEIIKWNPEYIFFDSGGVPLVKEDYKTNPNYYKQLKAVENNKLYQYPSSTAYYANLETSLANSYYVGSILYPEQFKDIKFEEKAQEIFKFFINSDDYLKQLEESGSGYAQVDLNK